MKSLYPKKRLVSFCNLKTLVVSTMLWSLLSFTSYGLNPGKIEGLVSDGTSYATIPAAKVELLNATDSTVIKTVLTNNDGKYVIDDVAFGKYLLRISGMTYQKQIVPDVDLTPEKPVIKFGTTNLLPEAKMLKEVGIFGYKLTGQMEDDKTIYTIKSKSADIAQSGLDLLRQLPDINVDFRTNEVTLAGNSNILFQVNGKKVDKSYLMQLNPKIIDKVEILTNPGVKYDADVDAVINIILKKNMAFGLSGRISLEIPTSKTYFSNNNFSLDYFTKGMRFFVSGWGGMDKWDIDMNSIRTNTPYPDSLNSLKKDISGTNNEKYGGFNYGMDWFINDNNIFNFYSSVNPGIPDVDDFTSDNVFTPNKGIATHTTAASYKKSDDFFNDYSFFYKHKFAKKDHELSLESYYSKNRSNSNETYLEHTYLLPDSIISNHDQLTNNRKWQLTFKIDYTYPFTDKLKLSVGYNGNLNRITNSYTNNNIISDDFTHQLSDQIHYNENRNSAYSNIAWNVGNFNLQTGIRFESSDIQIQYKDTSNGNYHCFLPFASVQYKLGKKQTFRFNYRKSINRPGMSQVSPFGYREDAYTVELGNPGLSPAYVNKLEFTHRIQLMGPMYISYRPYLSFINNGIRQINLPMVGSVAQRQYVNVSDETEYGVVFSGTLAFVKWWAINPSYTYYKREIKDLPDYGILADKRTAWRLGVSQQFILPKDWVIFVDYNYSSPVITAQSKDQRNYQFVTGFYKSIKKKFNITVFTLNPGDHRFEFMKNTTTTSTMVQNTTGAVKYNWILNIRLGYSFNKGKEGKKVDRQVETDSDAGGKKGLL